MSSDSKTLNQSPDHSGPPKILLIRENTKSTLYRDEALKQAGRQAIKMRASNAEIQAIQ